MSAHDHLPIPDLGITGAEADTRFAQLQAEARAALTPRPLPSP